MVADVYTSGMLPRVIVERVIKRNKTASVLLTLRAPTYLTSADLNLMDTIRIYSASTRRAASMDLALSSENETAFKEAFFYKQNLPGAKVTEYSDVHINVNNIINNGLVSSDRAFKYYNLGTFSIPIESKLKFAFIGAAIFNKRIGNINYLSLSTFIYKRDNKLFPEFLEREFHTDHNRRRLIEATTFLGEDSFLNAYMEIKEREDSLEKTSPFSYLFPSLLKNKLHLAFFLDVKRLLSNNSEAYNYLSSAARGIALQHTTIKKQDFYKQRVNPDLGGSLLFNYEKEKLNLSLDSTFFEGSTHPEVFLYSTQHDISLYEENLNFGYETQLKFVNGMSTVRDHLTSKIQEIEEFQRIMLDVFNRRKFYNPILDQFNHGASFIDLKRRLVAANPRIRALWDGVGEEISTYYGSLLKQIMLSIKDFTDNIFIMELTTKAGNELEKCIDLNYEARTNKHTFTLFFNVFNSLKKILNTILSIDGFGIKGLKNKTANLAKRIPHGAFIKVNHDFSYAFDTNNNQLRYSYLDEKSVSDPLEAFPSMALLEGGYLDNLKEGYQKYYKAGTIPKKNNTLSAYEYENVSRVKIDRSTFLSVREIKNGENTIADLTKNFGWDPYIFLNHTLNILLHKILNTQISDLDEPDDSKSESSEKLYRILEHLSISLFRPSELDISLTDALLDPRILSILSPDETEEVEARAPLDPTVVFGLSIFFDLLDDIIENYPNVSYDRLFSEVKRNKQELLKAFLHPGYGTGRPGYRGNPTLPWQLYALYENCVPLDIDATADFERQTNFNWNNRDVLRFGGNIPTLRLNFGNLVQLETLTGFGRLQDGSLNLKDPLFKKADFREMLAEVTSLSDDEFIRGTREAVPEGEPGRPRDLTARVTEQNYFCRLRNYNFGNYGRAWFLDDKNLLGMNYETEHLILRKEGFISQDDLEILAPPESSLRTEARDRAEEGARRTAEEAASEREAITTGLGAPDGIFTGPSD